MVHLRHTHAILLAMSILAMTFPAQAAPVRQHQNGAIDKYLPDDTHFVLVADLKQIFESPAFKKHYQQQAADLLKMEIVQTYLKDTGFDPLKDTWQLIFAMGKSSHGPEGTFVGNFPGSGSGPMVILEGRFDPAKLEAKAAQLAKDMPNSIHVHSIGTNKLYELSGLFGPPGPALAGSNSSAFLALPDKNTLVFSMNKDHVVAALDKGLGKKKTKLACKSLEDMLGKLDRKQCVAFGAGSEMIIGSSTSGRGNPNGQTTWEVKHQTLAEQGLEGFKGGISLGDDRLRGKGTVTAKDGDTATKIAGIIDQGLKMVIEQGTREMQRMPGLAPVLEALKTVKTSTDGNSITLEGSAGAEAPLAMIQSIFMARAMEPRPVPQP
jgi:hypothetical protein